MEKKLLFWVIFWIIIGLILWYLTSKIYFLIQQKKYWKKSVQKSKSVILGQVHEKVAPMLSGFPYNPKDMTFIWKGVDYVIFQGLSSGNLKEIIFLEIKTGQSTLNRNERMIQQCIKNKKVAYKIFKKNY